MDRKNENTQPKPSTKKKAYRSPSLVEYGNLAKLTQGMTGSFADAMGMSMLMA